VKGPNTYAAAGAGAAAAGAAGFLGPYTKIKHTFQQGIQTKEQHIRYMKISKPFRKETCK